MKRARVTVRGLVQGVYFRADTQTRAQSLGVRGWVRNAGDGSLEAVFEGEGEPVESMVAWCHRGPAGARVDDVEVTWEEPAEEQDFRVM